MKNKKFRWEQDNFHKCCWTLYYEDCHFGVICENGCGAIDGNAVHVFGNIEERKKQFEKMCLIELKVRAYGEKLCAK